MGFFLPFIAGMLVSDALHSCDCKQKPAPVRKRVDPKVAAALFLLPFIILYGVVLYYWLGSKKKINKSETA